MKSILVLLVFFAPLTAAFSHNGKKVAVSAQSYSQKLAAERREKENNDSKRIYFFSSVGIAAKNQRLVFPVATKKKRNRF